MKLTIAGCGDAFGSGGRLQTCYHVEADERAFLIDCGATALIGLNRLGLEPNTVGTILISHLHGDHFSGLVWWMLHAHHVSRRTEPLTVAGPPGIAARYAAASEALFPGSTAVPLRFDLRFQDLREGEPADIDGIRVLAREVSHPSGAPSYALRIEAGGRTIAFTGDTEWVDALPAIADGADLLIAECYGFQGAVRYHMSWAVIREKLAQLKSRRILLVHMNAEMLANIAAIEGDGVIVGEDGLTLLL